MTIPRRLIVPALALMLWECWKLRRGQRPARTNNDSGGSRATPEGAEREAR